MTRNPTARIGRKAVPDKAMDAVVHNKATDVVVRRADALPRENGTDTMVVAAMAAPGTVSKVNAEIVRNEVARHRTRAVIAGMVAVPTGMVVASMAKDVRSRARDVRSPGPVDVRPERPHRQVARRVVQVEAVVRKLVRDRGVRSLPDVHKGLVVVRRDRLVVRKDRVVVRRRMHARNSVVPTDRTIRSSTLITIRSMLRDIPTIVVDVAIVPVDAATAPAAQVRRSEAEPLVMGASRR